MLLKFHQIVLRKIIIIFLLLLIIVGAVLYFWIKDFYISQTKESLLNNISIISFNVENNHNLNLLAKKVKNELHLRLTIISENGVVLAQSYKVRSRLNNYDRIDEIMKVAKETYGYKIAHSNSLNKDLMYISKRYNFDSGTVYIALAKELKNINEQIYMLEERMLGVLAVFFVILFISTYKLSRSIEEETQKIVIFLTSLTKKRKSTHINSNFSLEFFNITNLLTKISIILVKKDKQKIKFTSKLQTSNKQKDDIISAISHEFKNPIAVINGYSQTLLDDENINPNIRQKFINKIYKNGLKLNDLIDTLRLSSKLDSGQQTMFFKTTNLSELVHDAVENIKLNYPKRQAVIMGDASINIQTDSALFSIVVTNLVENAFKYSEDEVTITFDGSSLDVIDTGIGISKANLINITNKFYRVHENSWNNSLGLGLFIVNNIVKLHNYSLAIKSIENEGSIFSVKF